MLKTNIPFKATIGYAAIATILIVAIALVYSNTKSILAINQASREYIEKRDSADNAMSTLLKEEQSNLKQLVDAMERNMPPNYLHEKLRNLNIGKDSVIVHPKTAQAQETKTTTVEVMKTRKGFFHRLADAFKKEYAETLSVKKDSNRASFDTIAPVNVAENVADILEQIEAKEKHASKGKKQIVNKEMAELQMTNAQLALQSAKQLNAEHQRERLSMQQTINKAITARQHLLWQIGLLAIIAFATIIILIWYICHDFKKERIYRENLESANEEIQRVMKQRERLLLTITHDIKAPASSISGFIDLLKEHLHDEQALSYLSSIRHSATHLSQLVASLLDYHQLENGLLELHPVSFCPQKLVEQCVEDMEIQARQKALVLDCDTQNCSSLCLADAFRIRQILNNLISNAIKYTDQGSVCISAVIHDNRQLTLKVKDTGKGMTPEESKRIFQAFIRLENAQGIEGTGLGLSITQELVSLLGGNLQLKSVKGKGSCFTVNLPITPCAEKEMPQQTHLPLKNHKILILDDDKLQLRLLQEMLHHVTDNQWQVFTTTHISEALTLLHQEHPCLMLMDIEMPEMNGTSLIQHINHDQMTIVAMTAHDESIMKELKQAGFDSCLFKPFNMEKLCEILGCPKKNESRTNITPLLAFAENDPTAEKEILDNLKKDLEDYLERFGTAEEKLDKQIIGKAAHKLLPIATMLSFNTIDQIKALAPEQIMKLEDREIQAYAQSIKQEIARLLEELKSSFRVTECMS